jgi:hypothetical protein
VLESEKREEEKDLAGAAKTQLGLAHRTVSGAPGWLPANWPLSGELGDVRLKFTGLSGEPTAYNATVGRAIRGRRVARANSRLGAPDCLVCTGLSGVHRTVSGAPTSLELQRSAAPGMEGNRAPDMNSGCPVVHRTIWCATRQKARLAFLVGFQRLLAALGL